MSSRYYYHLTPTRNVQSILRTGLDPRAARGQRVAVWLCVYGQLYLLIGHLARRHRVRWWGMSLCVVRVDARYLRGTRFRGRYVYLRPIPPADIRFLPYLLQNSADMEASTDSAFR